MSALALHTLPTAMPGQHQPDEAIKLEIFHRLDRLPFSYFVHLAQDNRNAPMIRAGEIIVIDQGGAAQGGWYPTEGGLFLIEYRSEPINTCERYPRGSREVVQTHEGKHGWYASPLSRGAAGKRFVCSDGPYNSEQQLADKLIGKVVGLYAPGALAGRALQ